MCPLLPVAACACVYAHICNYFYIYLGTCILNIHGSMPILPILVWHLRFLSSLPSFQVCESLPTVRNLIPTNSHHPVRIHLQYPNHTRVALLLLTHQTYFCPSLCREPPGSQPCFLRCPHPWAGSGREGRKGREEKVENSHSLLISFLFWLKI